MLVQRGATQYAQDLVAPLSQVLSDGTATYVYGHERLTALGQAWYLGDALGSVRQTLDSTGAVQATASYAPFGEVQGSTIAPWGFTGELQDQGLVNLRARWYDPRSGVFTGVDPWGGTINRPRSLHTYLYAEDDSINYRDPTGWARCQLELPAVGPSQCDQMIATIRRLEAAAKPSPQSELLYRATGRSLWKDVSAIAVAEHYAGVDRTTAALALAGGGTAASTILSAALATMTTRPREQHNFVVTRPVGDQQQDILISAGEAPCPCPDVHNPACPTAREQLDYGFKPDYWSNTHHFFVMFFFGYAGGQGTGTTIADGYEHLSTVLNHGLSRPPNQVDLRVGRRAAERGFAFRWPGAVQAGRLADDLDAELCLSQREQTQRMIAALR